jgi:hypothetical protein
MQRARLSMTEANIIAFNESFERCMASGRFFDVFYDHFLGSSSEIAAKFQGTDFGRQKRMLKLSPRFVDLCGENLRSRVRCEDRGELA